MRFEDSQRLYLAFNYDRPLRSEEARLYVDRTDSVRGEFTRQFRFPGTQKLLMLGAVGSGKSTELYRLAELHRRSAREPVVGVLPLTAHFDVNGMQPIEVLVTLGLAATQLAPAGQEPPAALIDAVEDAWTVLRGLPASAAKEERGSLRTVMKNVFVLVGHGAQALAGVVPLVPDAVVQASAEVLAQVIPDRPLSVPPAPANLTRNERRVTEVVQAVNDLVRWVRESRGARPMTLFVDGLDKIFEPQRATDMFAGGILAQLELPMVMAAPLVLRIDPTTVGGLGGFRTAFLGNFRVFDKHADGGHDEIGFRSMRAIFVQRVRELGMEPAAVIAGGADPGGQLDRLVEASGGLVRDFVMLCRIAVEHASDREDEDPIHEDEVTAAIHELRQRYLQSLTTERLRILIATLQSQLRQPGEQADRLLITNHVLGYGNGAPWYRPHALLVPYLREIAPRLAGPPAPTPSAED
ncbi:MAG: hypothetical protein ABIO70_01410 [Pseudomonadota bacterium]